jgi:hypothetical protein
MLHFTFRFSDLFSVSDTSPFEAHNLMLWGQRGQVNDG